MGMNVVVHRRSRIREAIMDFLFLGIVLVLALTSFGLTAGCDRLRG
jgi:hypothetical protein